MYNSHDDAVTGVDVNEPYGTPRPTTLSVP